MAGRPTKRSSTVGKESIARRRHATASTSRGDLLGDRRLGLKKKGAYLKSETRGGKKATAGSLPPSKAKQRAAVKKANAINRKGPDNEHPSRAGTETAKTAAAKRRKRKALKAPALRAETRQDRAKRKKGYSNL